MFIDEKHAIKQERAIMLLLFAVAMIVRLWFLPTYQVISADGIGYVSVAKELMRGSVSFWSANHPPIYPALIAFTGLFVPDMELAGRLVSIFMGSLLAIPLYLVGRDLFSREVGIIAALVAAVWPPLRSWSCEVMSQATYLTLLLAGFYLFLLMVRLKRPVFGFLSGVLMGLAYLTRPEVLMVYAAMLFFEIVRLCLEVEGRSRHRFGALLSGLAGFLVLLIPYLLILKVITGSWQLTGKSGPALADALSRYLEHPDLKRELGFQSLGYLDVIKRYPDFVVQNARYNLAKTWDIFAPKWLWIAAFVGFVFAGKSKESVWERLFLCSLFAPLLVLITFFFVGPEYLQFYLPPFFLWGAHGLVMGLSYGSTLLGREPRQAPYQMTSVSYAALSLTAVFIMFSLVSQMPKNSSKPYHFSDDGARYDQKRLGLLLKEQLPSGSKIMSRSGRIMFYSGLPGVDMPQAPLNEILSEACRASVRFLIVEGHLISIRPQLGVLFAPLFNGEAKEFYRAKGAGPEPLPDVSLYLVFKDPSSVGVAVYEICQNANMPVR